MTLYTDTLRRIAIWFHAIKNVNTEAYLWFCQRHSPIQFILNCCF